VNGWRALRWFVAVAGSGFKEITHALYDNFFKLCMLLGMDITFLKTTAHKLGRPLVAVMQKIPDGRHWKLNRQYLGSYYEQNLL